MLDDLFKGRVDGKKPRQEALTLTVDKIESFDRENFEILAAFIDQNQDLQDISFCLICVIIRL